MSLKCDQLEILLSVYWSVDLKGLRIIIPNVPNQLLEKQTHDEIVRKKFQAQIKGGVIKNLFFLFLNPNICCEPPQ